MQILKWLSRTAQQHQKIVANSSSSDDRIVVSTTDGGSRRREDEALKFLCFLQRKDVSKACFYHTLNLKRLSGRQHWRGKRKEDGDHRAGNKVLPITDSTQASSTSSKNIERECGTRKLERRKPVSRMKELVKWAADSKTKFSNRRKVLHLEKSRAALKAAWGDDDEDEVGNASPGISSGTGNWITSDSEFVVLELRAMTKE